MKIISKYKDFYDYMVSDYEANVVYNRVSQIINKNYNNLFDCGHYKESYGQWRLTYSHTYVTHFSNVVYGIFPYVYSQPVIMFEIPYFANGNKTTIIKTLSQDEFEALKSQENLKQMILSFIDEQFDEYIKVFSNLKSKNMLYHSKEDWTSAFKDDLLYITSKAFQPYYNDYWSNFKKQFVWKKECKEIFNNVKAPIFIMFNKDLFEENPKSPYKEMIFNFYYGKNHKQGQKIYYITNIVFSQIKPNILKYWWNDINELQTYINIENFIAMSKLEPIANPDNKTKIVSHGFDLKTSFRNM